MNKGTKVILTLLFVATGAAVQAAVSLPSFFGNHMVLQRGMPVAIWGTADSAESVEVTFCGQDF